MPRYFFHVHDGTESIDRDGVELAGDDEAKTMAVCTAADLLHDIAGRFWSEPEWWTWVTDESGATIVPFRRAGREVRGAPAEVHSGSGGTGIQNVGSNSHCVSMAATHRPEPSMFHHSPTCQPPCSGQKRR